MPPFFAFPELLEQIQKRNPQFRLRLLEGRLLRLWPELVGETISRHAQAIRVQERVLWLAVEHPVWKSELTLRKSELLKKLNVGIKNQMEFSGQEHPFLKDIAFVEASAHQGKEQMQSSGKIWFSLKRRPKKS